MRRVRVLHQGEPSGGVLAGGEVVLDDGAQVHEEVVGVELLRGGDDGHGDLLDFAVVVAV